MKTTFMTLILAISNFAQAQTSGNYLITLRYDLRPLEVEACMAGVAKAIATNGGRSERLTFANVLIAEITPAGMASLSGFQQCISEIEADDTLSIDPE